MVQIVVLTWRSIYEFAPAAVKEIIKEFQARGPAQKAMKCTFNPKTQSFTLEGDKNSAEEHFLKFIEIVQTRILTQVNKRRQTKDEGEVTIRRIGATMLNARALHWTENPEEDVDDFENDIDFSAFTPEEEELDGKQYTITRKWLPSQKHTFADCFHREGRDLAQEIAKACGPSVVIVSDWIDGEVKIGAASESDFEKAVRKLEKVESNFLRPFTPKVAHLINNEGVVRYELAVVLLTKQASSALRTTIFPPESDQADELCFQRRWLEDKNVKKLRVCTVRMMQYDAGTEKYKPTTIEMKPVHTAENPSPEPRDWKGFVYMAKDRDIDDNATVVTVSETYATATALRSESSVAPPKLSKPIINPIKADPTTGQLLLGPRPQSVADSEDRPDAGVESAAPRRRAREPKRLMPSGLGTDTTATTITSNVSATSRLGNRAVRGDSGSTSSQVGGVSLGSTFESRATKAVLPSRTASSRAISSVPKESSPSGFSQNSTADVIKHEQGHLQPEHTQENRHVDNAPYQPHIPGLGFDLGSRPGAKGPTEPAILSDGSRAPVTTRRVRTPKGTSMPRPPSNSQDGVEPKNVKYVLNGMAALDLIKDEEKLRHQSEVESRIKSEFPEKKVINTMNQKAPPARRNKAEEDPILIAKHKQAILASVFTNGFEQARTLRGEIKFEAKLGRVLLWNVPNKNVRNDYTWKGWDEQLKSWEGLSIVFADMMTLYHFDAEFVADLKVEGGFDVFATVPQRSVTYSFECEGVMQSKFTIDVDGNTFKGTAYQPATSLGDVYWHCPNHAWDAEISLTHANVMEDRQDSVDTLIGSIQIAEGKHIPELEYKLSHVDFQVHSVVCKREALYDCNRKDFEGFVIAIVEHQELKIQQKKSNPGLCRARATAREDMIAKNKLWYTFTIRHKDIDEALVQNLDLEVGEDADWTTDKLLKMPGRSLDDEDSSKLLDKLQNMLNVIVSRIDGVGAYNLQYYEEPKPEEN